MSKSTFGFHKLVGVTITSIEAHGDDIIDLFDANGVRYQITARRDLNLTKKSPRKSRTKRRKTPELTMDELNHRLKKVQQHVAAWPYPSKEQANKRQAERDEVAEQLKFYKNEFKKHKAERHNAEALTVGSLTLHYVSVWTIEKVLKPIVTTHLRFDERRINADTKIFLAAQPADYLDRVEFWMAVEDDFGLVLPDEETDAFGNELTFSQVVTMLHIRLNSQLHAHDRSYVPGLK